MSYMNDLLFGVYPYLAGTIFLLGSWIRFDKDQYSWKAGSSQMLSSKGFRKANTQFHVGILLLFVGHLFGLLTPPSVYHAFGLTTEIKQLIAMVMGGIFGIICFLGMTALVKRRLTDPRVKATSNRSDVFILLLIYVQLILGLLSIFVSGAHMDGQQMLLLAEWAQQIVTFHGGAAEALLEVNWLYKLHILVGLTMFFVFPFTRLVHVWSAPIWYFGRNFQVVRKRS
ncbi:MAG: respiratory nitrate reductase subunit gamma [Methylococcales bacterium]|nr:respiratory nitrate reductase subunit gamma [Methylococcales bacterium]MBT5436263.1 respiratory nitrate reductase subunit gamma [Methylococcales bacterium]